jgi:hypothetical protein
MILPRVDSLISPLESKHSGERGGPQQHPWEAGLAFSAGFLGQTDTLLAGAAGADADEDGGAAAGDDGGALVTLASGEGADGNGYAHAGGSPTAHSPSRRAGPMALDGPWPAAGSMTNANATAAAAAVARRQGVDHVRVHRRFMPFPQPYGLAAALLEVQLWLLGKLLAVVPAGAKVQVLEVRCARVDLFCGASS